MRFFQSNPSHTHTRPGPTWRPRIRFHGPHAPPVSHRPTATSVTTADDTREALLALSSNRRALVTPMRHQGPRPRQATSSRSTRPPPARRARSPPLALLSQWECSRQAPTHPSSLCAHTLPTPWHRCSQWPTVPAWWWRGQTASLAHLRHPSTRCLVTSSSPPMTKRPSSCQGVLQWVGIALS